MASLFDIAKKRLEEAKKKAKKKVSGIRLDEGLRKIVSSVGRGGLEVGAAIQRKLPKEVVSPATTFTKILTERPERTPMGIAKGIFKVPRMGLELSNIITGTVEAGVRGLAERTPLKRVKAKVPYTGIELTAPGVLGFGAALAVPIPGGAKVRAGKKAVSKIPKVLEPLAKEARKIKTPSEFISKFGKQFNQIKGDLPLSSEYFWRQANNLPLPKPITKIPPTLGGAADFLKQQRIQATKGVEIPKELEPLAAEARKYKSAKEFMKNFKIETTPSGWTSIGGKPFLQSQAYDLLRKVTGTIEDVGIKRPVSSKEAVLAQKKWQPIYEQKLKDFYTQATKGVEKAIPKELKPLAKETKEFGFTGQGLKEVTTEIPLDDIPKRSITTPEYRDERVVAVAGRKVTKPIVAVVEDINNPNSPLEIVDGWHRWRQAVANKDKNVPIKYIFKPTEKGIQVTKGVEGVTKKGIQRAVGKLPTEGLPVRPAPSPEVLGKPVQAGLPKLAEAGLPPAGNVPSAIAPSGGIVPQLGKERGFITTAKEAAITAPEVKATIQGTYTPITNVKTFEDAQRFVQQNGVDIAKDAIEKSPWSAETNLVGQELARVAQNAGRFDEAGDIIEKLSIKGTQAGQGNQAFAVWSNLTPEGMIRYAQRSMADANKKLDMFTKGVRAVLRKPEIKLTPADTEYISNMMKQANSAATDEEKAILVRKTWEYIGKKLPWGVSDILDEYRYNNMLSNPLTHIRNAWSNIINTFITRPATLAAQGKPLKAMSYELGALKSLPKGTVAFFKAVREGASFGKMDITKLSKAGPIKPKRLGIYNLPSNLMEGGDKFFRALIEGGEKATGTTAEEARQIAEYSLFRSDLFPAGQGVLLNKVDELTKAAYGLRSVGLGWFIPFIRTPMNVAKQWIEFSPMGITTTLGAAKPKEQLAKAFLGSVATVMGANMALEGRTTWAPPSDATARKLFYDSGRKPYSVKIGNTWVPLQTTGVFAWALGLPAAVKYYQDEAPKAFTDTNVDKLGAMIFSPLGFWTDQTFVTGLGSFVKLAQGDIDWNFPRTVGYTASQIKPFNGLLRYVANVIDPVFRKPKTIEQQLVSDIPGMTRNLPFYETSTGEPARRNIPSYFTPYSVGIGNQQFEEPYQQRMYKLQYNAIMRQVENGEISKEEGERKVKELLPGIKLESPAESIKVRMNW